MGPERDPATGPRRVLLTIAASAAWASPARSPSAAVAFVYVGLSFDSLRRVDDVLVYVFGGLELVAAIAFVLGAERTRAVAIAIVLAMAVAGGVAVDAGRDDPGVMALALAFVLELVVAVRCARPGAREPGPGARGLHRLATGLWWHAILSLAAVGTLIVLQLQELDSLEVLRYAQLGSFLAPVVPLGYAIAGAFGAAQARVGATWRLAIGGVGLHAGAMAARDGMFGVVVGVIGPLLVGLGLVALPGTRDARVSVGVAVGLGGFAAVMVWLRLVDVATASPWQLDAYRLGVLAAVAFGQVLLARVSRAHARVLERDPDRRSIACSPGISSR